jgi:hypothetical protein
MVEMVVYGQVQIHYDDRLWYIRHTGLLSSIDQHQSIRYFAEAFDDHGRNMFLTIFDYIDQIPTLAFVSLSYLSPNVHIPTGLVFFVSLKHIQVQKFFYLGFFILFLQKVLLIVAFSNNELLFSVQ